MNSDKKRLDLGQPEELKKFESDFNSLIIGQSESGKIFTVIRGAIKAGTSDPNRPRSVVMMIGPTGVGKTKSIKTFAHLVTGSEKKLLNINCESMIDDGYSNMVIGSALGYVGCDVEANKHEAVEPMLSQKNLDEHGGGDPFTSFVNCDEIEKGGLSMRRLLMTPMEEGYARLGTGKTTDMTRTVLSMTSNVGAREIEEAMGGKIGFAIPKNDVTPEDIAKMRSIAITALEKEFTPEFRNRIDHIVVFLPLDLESMSHVLDLELMALQRTLLQNNPLALLFSCGNGLKRYLRENGFSKKYGARFMRRMVTNTLTPQLSNLILNGGFDTESEHILLDLEGGDIYATVDDSIDRDANESLRKKILDTLTAASPAEIPSPETNPDWMAARITTGDKSMASLARAMEMLQKGYGG